MHRQFVHAGIEFNLLTNAHWIVPLFSTATRRQDKASWSKLGLGKCPGPPYSAKFCEQFAALLCSEAQNRRAANKDNSFKATSSLRLLGCWPAIPLCFTTGAAEEDRIASVTTPEEDGQIAPIVDEETIETLEKKKFDKKREKDEEFRYMCEWLAKQKVPAKSYL